MAGIDKLQSSGCVEKAKKERGVPRRVRVGTNETIDLSEYARRLLPGGHRREGSLKDGAQQRCPHAFAADISHDKGGAVGAELHQIKIVAPHRQSRAIEACDL